MADVVLILTIFFCVGVVVHGLAAVVTERFRRDEE
jgi:hypothetical protein